MKHPIIMAFTLTLVACTSQSPREIQSALAAGGAAFAERPASPSAASDSGAAEIVDATTVQAEDLDNGRICEQVKRPGSNMTQTFCYTREERVAQQTARDKERNDQLSELEREARWRDEIIRQATMEGRRPSGFGLGPN